ncbi:MAG: hypothetical protein HY913_03285 [Desulfomonile tiedjei]|nr:hypothetical protein [Desulfomonile tiedjei]
MSEPVQIILSFFFLVGIFVLTRYIIASKMKRATGLIIRDLEKQDARDPVTAVDLPYAKRDVLRIGMRNYHAKAVEDMVSAGVVGKTGGGKYYLRVSSSSEQS